MSTPPPLRECVIGAAWTGVSGIPLAAEACLPTSCTAPSTAQDVPHGLAGLDTTALFRFLTASQGLATADEPSPPLPANTDHCEPVKPTGGPGARARHRHTVIASLPCHPADGALRVGSGVLTEPDTGIALLRVAVLLASPPGPLNSPTQAASRATWLTQGADRKAADTKARARLTECVNALLDSLSEALCATATMTESTATSDAVFVRNAIVAADAAANACAASYTVRTVQQSSTVTLSSLCSDTQARMMSSTEEPDAVCALLPPWLWSRALAALRTAASTDL